MGKTLLKLANEALDRSEKQLEAINELLTVDIADFKRYKILLTTFAGEEFELHTYCIDGFDAYCKVSDMLASEPFIQVSCNCGLRYIKSDSVREIFVEA